MAALAKPPFRGVESLSRAELLDEARDDPLGHGTLLALDSAAVVALLLAALGLALTVLSDLRDDRGDLYDLESQGAEPRLLRRIVRVRALVVGIAGVLAGAAAGALLALLVTRVVSVTARATTSDLPMQTSFDLRVLVSPPSPTCCSRRRSWRSRPGARSVTTAALPARRRRGHEPDRGPRPLLRLPGSRRRRRRAAGPDARRRGGRDLRHPRPERIGQDDADAGARRIRAAERRQHRRRRPAARLALAAPPRRLPGDDARVRRPALLARAGRRADRRGARRGPARPAGRPGAGAPRAGARAPRAGRPARSRRCAPR